MEWLNFHHLRYFWMVAREGSLRRAAEKMHVSQPSISAQLRLLEEALGEPLFRRSGRGLLLTATGRMALSYADEIFSLGRELLSAVRQETCERPVRLHVGAVDSVPKLAAYRVLRPAFDLRPPVHLVCREGKLDELLPLLAAHRLDLVLADEPAPSALKLKVFNHPLGSTGITWCAAGPLAARLRRNFPRSLHGAPALLPSENTAFRLAVNRWLDARDIAPRVLAEFEDSALMKAMASGGAGFFPITTVALADAVGRQAFKAIGEADGCRLQLHAITAERRLKHPAVAALTEHAQRVIFT